jgi:hypothetical protein
LEHLAAGLWPELADLRVLFASEVPGDWGASGIAGLSGQALWAMLGLEDPAPCVLLVDDTIRAEAAGLAEGDVLGRVEALRWAFARLLLHELSHCLEAAPPYFATPPATFRPAPEAVAFLLSLPPDTIEELSFGNVDSHSPQFYRLLTHGCWRARELFGLDVRPPAAAGPNARLAVRAAEALGDEPSRLASASAEEIKATCPPPAFAELWANEENEPMTKRTPMIESTTVEELACLRERLAVAEEKLERYGPLLAELSEAREARITAQARASREARLRVFRSEISGLAEQIRGLAAQEDRLNRSAAMYREMAAEWPRGHEQREQNHACANRAERSAAEIRERMADARRQMEKISEEEAGLLPA